MKNPSPSTGLAARLEAVGLGGFALALLEAGGEPLAFLAAQGLYVAQPFLGMFVGEAQLAALARCLEDPAARSLPPQTGAPAEE
jgi:hypothetical protein